MYSHLQLVGSILIGSLLLLAILNYSSTMSSKSYEYTYENIVRENTARLSELILHDFRRMGYQVANPANVIQSFSSNSIEFLADIDGNSTIDTVRYSVSSTSDASHTQNPNDRLFYRQINGSTQEDIGLGVTNFNLNYYDDLGNTATSAVTIASIEIQITVESLYGWRVADDSTYYPQNYWQTIISPPNINK